MWTRDSAVQMGIYLSRERKPWLRHLLAGFVRRSAFNIVQDPYANAYERTWKDPSGQPVKDAVIGRGGWVATKNYELDSNAYFLHFLWDFYVAPDVYRPDITLQDPLVYDAVLALVNVVLLEQHHETQSDYRYFELDRGGLGTPTNYTGMSWTGFRPSDDKCQYHYLIPANIYAAGALERLIALNQHVWKSTELHNKATKLLSSMEEGIAKYGVVKSAEGDDIYAYEVDGLGKSLADFDDANVPSLLSIPLLGWTKYDRQIYRNTRRRLLDPKINKFYYDGAAFRGQGSPHTPLGYV